MDLITNDSMVELESLDAPSWGDFLIGVGAGIAVGVVIFT